MLTTGNVTINAVLDHRLRVDGDRPFLIFEPAGGRWSEFSYRAFAAMVGRAANALKALGIGAGDRVALFMGNRPEFLVHLFAAQRLGAVVVPTIALYKAAELEYVLDHCRARCLISEASLMEVAHAAAAGRALHRICVDATGDLPGGWLAVDPSACESGLSPDRSAADDLGLIMYSSGTTARPKGIEIACGAMTLAAESNAAHQRLQPQDRSLCMTPLFHGNALFISTLSAFVTGATVILLEKFDETRWIDQARVYRATVASLVAAAVRRLLATPARPEDGRHDLRFVLYGLPLRAEEIAAFEARYATPLVNLWGMTENVGTGTRSPLYLSRKPDRVGLPMWGLEMELRDEQGRRVSEPHVPGIAYFRGGCAMRSYHCDDQATGEALDADAWVSTGDLMAYDEEGYFTFLDRAKDMIKVRGENVASAEVERILMEHPAIREAAVFGVPDPVRDERIVAMIVLAEGHALDLQAVRDHCLKHAAHFKAPHEVMFVDGLGKTSIGKIQKGEMKKYYLERTGGRGGS